MRLFNIAYSLHGIDKRDELFSKLLQCEDETEEIE